jgi:NAD(P)-dependent dehydrogenase (short-subunit alcohol dehydrogenase family)
MHTAAIDIDWPALYAERDARPVDLPTYAFQRERYWLESSAGPGDLTAAGQSQAGHPLLGAMVRLAGGQEGWVFTGRLSLKSHPWIADHVVIDVVLLPGTAFVELALAAAQRVGAGELEELMLVAPLVFDDQTAVQLQVMVTEADESGRRPINIYSCSQGASPDEPGDENWVLHASGLLGAGDDVLGGESPVGEALEAFAAGSWPPEGAEQLDVEFVYDRLSEAGYHHGPVFQGLRQAFRVGDVWYAEVALEGEQQGQAAGFCVHPALADAALHAMLLGALDLRQLDAPEVPFSLSGVRLYGQGASSLRVRIERVQGGGADGKPVRLLALDERGMPVLAIESLKWRAVDVGGLKARAGVGHDSLFGVEWVEVPRVAVNGSMLHAAVVHGEEEGLGLDVPGIEVARYPDLEALAEAIGEGASAPEVVLVPAASAVGGGLARAVHEVTQRTLRLLQAWLACERLSGARLVLVTDGALAVSEDESPNLAQAALLGLMRSAQSENPQRFSVIDLDGSAASVDGLYGALVSEEPELALREGVLYAPRVARAKVDDHGPAFQERDGTILITGGTGGLGALLARHLAVEHGAGRLLLVSRSGREADGAEQLVVSLAELGCEAQIAACDVADRGQVQALIAGISPEHPLTAVVHAAGVLDDGVIDSLDVERLERVMTPKVDGAINLHELTKDLELSQFILFSSVASTLGNPGQGNYAAANAFLDGLAYHRRAEGLPATALAWGPWERATAMTGGVSDTDRLRAERLGATALSDEQGLALLDIARGAARPMFVPVRLDTAALRARAKAGALPAILQGLVRVPVRRAADPRDSLARRLAGAPEYDRQAIVLELVQSQVAGVLGHTSGEAIDPQRDFKDLGFDSLSAVELTNGLRRATGLRLPTTLIFDHPSPAAVAEFLRDESAGLDVAPGETHSMGGTLSALLRQAYERDSLVDFGNMLAAASKFRPAFESCADLERPPSIVSLAHGELTQLICIPSFMAGSGPHQFARLASGFSGGRSVSTVSLPGFRAAEAVPATWSAAIDALAASVREVAGHDAFVLAGYSGGVALAHALARRLEDDGVFPAGLVMIDTYAPESQDEMGQVFRAVMATILDRGHMMMSVDDDNLVAMGTYIRLVAEWEPLPIEAPSLLVRASEPIGNAVEGGRLPWWQLPHDVVEVAGHHFGVIEEAASETARVIDAWVRETIDESQHAREAHAQRRDPSPRSR